MSYPREDLEKLANRIDVLSQSLLLFPGCNAEQREAIAIAKKLRALLAAGTDDKRFYPKDDRTKWHTWEEVEKKLNEQAAKHEAEIRADERTKVLAANTGGLRAMLLTAREFFVKCAEAGTFLPAVAARNVEQIDAALRGEGGGDK